MAKNDEPKANSFNFTNLREASEYKMKISPEKTEELKKKSQDELVEELQIHQIELQMQNDELKKNQILLEESRDKYVDLYDFALVGYFVFNDFGLIEEVNLTGASFIGIERHNLMNKSFRQFVSHDNREIWDRHIFNVIKHNEKQSCDLLLVDKEAHSIYVRLDSIQLHTEDGKTKIRTAMSDITERKRAEEALQESEEKFRLLHENSGIGIGYYKPDGTVISFNLLAASHMNGIPEDFIGKSIYDIFPRQEAEFYHDRIKKAVISDGPVVYEDFVPLPESSKYFLSTFTKITDLKNNILGIQIISQDITERKQAEQQLNQSHELLTNLARLVPGVIYQYRLYSDGRSAFPYSSPGMNDIYEVTPEEVREDATPVFGRLHPEDYNYVSDSIQESARTLQTFYCEFRVILPRQGLRWRWSQAQPERMEDGGTLWYGIISDVTDRKNAEEEIKESNRRLEETLAKLKETQKQVLLQEKLRSLGQMTSGICHDINNSLSPIMGYTDMLRDDEELMKKHDKKLANIIKSTKNIASTIGRLKEFYRVKLEVDVLTEKDINKIINSTIELTSHKWKNMAESTGSVITIKKELQKDLPLTKVDESELIEALTNIILNACDSMIDGGTLTFRTYQKEANIVIEVKDTGMGMDEETLQHCLDPFYSTKGEQGTGLGLAMVFGVMERHKGEIKIESEKNKGTTVMLILPVDKSIIENIKIDEIVKDLKPLKILSVEDDKTISEMLNLILETKGNSVESALNGKVGLELYKQALEKEEPFDLVITDLGMAEMDGNSLSKAIKEITPDTPVILLTGWGTLIDKNDYKTVDCLLKKPIMMEDLFKAIAGLFGDK